jgi:hypothetical protein
MSDLPHARGGAAVARWELASQQLLYMYGGCSIVQCYDGLMRLDLYRGKWTTEQVKGTPPKKRKGHTLNLLGRSLDEQVLLVIGGWSGDGVVPNGIKEYSIIHNQWQYRAFQGTPPPDRWAHTATSIDPEHVIVFGGEGTTPGPRGQPRATTRWAKTRPEEDRWGWRARAGGAVRRAGSA